MQEDDTPDPPADHRRSTTAAQTGPGGAADSLDRVPDDLEALAHRRNKPPFR